MEFITALGIGYLPLGGLFAMILGLVWMYWLSQKTKYWRYVLFGQLIFAFVVIAIFVSGDPSFVVLDEFVAAGLLVLATRNNYWLLTGLVLFALLDWLKPVIHHVEKLPGALGVLGDDLLAALLALVILLIIMLRTSFYTSHLMP